VTNYSPIPIIGLLIAVAVLIFLVLRTKVHPLIAMIAAACIAGISGGMSAEKTINAIAQGFGSTLGNIGIVIGLGVMMGRILEVSGAAEQIAFTFIRWLGKRREEWALAWTGYLVSIPIFADSAFVILFPVGKALAKKGGRSILTLGVSLAGGLVVTHTLVPPTPGPLGAAGIFGVDIGAMMILGMVLGIPCIIAVVMYAQWLEKKYPEVPDVEAQDIELQQIHDKYVTDKTGRPLPGLTLSLLPIVVPIVLIFIKALINIIPALAQPDEPSTAAIISVLNFIGAPIIALSISTLLAVYLLVPYLDREATSKRLEEGLQSAGIILVVTGAGGALGVVVRESGAGALLADQITRLPLSPIMVPFIIATLIRFIQGSATVSCITTASICAPILSQIPDVNMLFAAQATASGAFFFSYFNDSLFWVVSRMIGITDVKKQLTAWSVATTIPWAIGGISIALLNLLFGAGGTLLDPLLPAGIMVIIFVVIRFKSGPG
jgi:gluconate:H+ symporter, GntP family